MMSHLCCVSLSNAKKLPPFKISCIIYLFTALYFRLQYLSQICDTDPLGLAGLARKAEKDSGKGSVVGKLPHYCSAV